MTAPLDHVLRHNAWANKTLLEFCATLQPAALDLRAGGTYGTLIETLRHLVSGEQWYISLLTGEVLGKPIREREKPPLQDLVPVAALTGARAIAISETDDADRAIDIHGNRSTVGTILAQLVNHGNEHRGHATTILGANDRETPLISGWRYGIANGISVHDGDS